MEQSKMTEKKKTRELLYEVGIMLLVTAVIVGEGIYQGNGNQWKVLSGEKLFTNAFIQPGNTFSLVSLDQENLYILALSVFFSFLGNKEEFVLIFNIVLQLVGFGFFYLGARKIHKVLYPIEVLVVGLGMSIYFHPIISDTPMHIIWFLTGFLFWVCACLFTAIGGMFLKHILIGVLLGIFCYVDGAGIFLVAAFVGFTFFTRKFTLKEKGIQFFFFFLCIINAYFCMFYLWNDLRFDALLLRQWLNNIVFSIQQWPGRYQYATLGLILAGSVIVYTVKSRKEIRDDGGVWETLLKTEEMQKDAVTISEVPEAILENKEEEISSDTEKETETKKKVKFIENPLPLPKKHVKKEMSYAFEPTEDQMHYDLNNYRVDDDYDLKTGF